MSFSLSLTIKKILSDIFNIKNEKIDASRLEGTIPIETLPPAALERVVVVKDDAARFALTKEKAQNGDTIKVNDTKKMYFVNDDTKLNVEDGYEEYITGGAASAAIADKAKLALDSEKLGGLTLENIRNEVKTYPANLQDQSVKNRHLSPDLKITANNIADGVLTAENVGAYSKGETYSKGEVFSKTESNELYYNKPIVDNKIDGKVSRNGDTINGKIVFTHDTSDPKSSTTIRSIFPAHYYHNYWHKKNRTTYIHAYPEVTPPNEDTAFGFRVGYGDKKFKEYRFDKDGIHGDLKGTATKTEYPVGFKNSYYNNAGWGNQDGKTITSWETEKGGTIDFRENGAQLNIKIDGLFYQNEGRYKVVDESTVRAVVEQKANTKVSKSGDTMTGALNFTLNQGAVAGKVGNEQSHWKLWGSDNRPTVAYDLYTNTTNSEMYIRRFINGNQTNLIKIIASDGNTYFQNNVNANRFYTSDWYRCNENCGIYWEKWGGGFNMTDGAWIRTFGDKNLYCNKTIKADGGFEGNLRGTADFATRIRGNKLIFENGTELWIE